MGMEAISVISEKVQDNNFKEVLDVELADTVRAHFLSADGSYHKLDLRGKEKVDSQQRLIELADAAVAERHKSIDKHEFIPEESPRE